MAQNCPYWSSGKCAPPAKPAEHNCSFHRQTYEDCAVYKMVEVASGGGSMTEQLRAAGAFSPSARVVGGGKENDIVSRSHEAPEIITARLHTNTAGLHTAYLEQIHNFTRLLDIHDDFGHEPTPQERQKLVASLNGMLDGRFPDVESQARALLARVTGKMSFWRRLHLRWRASKRRLAASLEADRDRQ